MKRRIYWLLALLGVFCMLHAPSSNAARVVGTTASTGLLSLTPGHVAILTLADVGGIPSAVVAAQLEILDGADRILASSRGELRPGQPLELMVRDDVMTGPRMPVRARVIVFDGAKLPTLLGPRRVLTFEMMNSSTGDIALVTLGPICFPGGGGIEFNCEGQLFLAGS
jgi:hypothetical protein